MTNGADDIFRDAAGAEVKWRMGPEGQSAGRDTIELTVPVKTVEIDEQQFELISKALADPKRFEILQKIAGASDAPTCSCMRDATGLAAATVSHHLKELDAAGLIRVERDGKFAHLTFRRDVWNAYLRKLLML